MRGKPGCRSTSTRRRRCGLSAGRWRISGAGSSKPSCGRSRFPSALRTSGRQELHPSAGATVIGARQFLIAFNINLSSGDLGLARRIARRIRASSGGLPCVKAVGVALSERGMVQVSVNLTDYRVTPPDAVLELVRSEAAASGVSVAETELYGVVPAAALIQEAARSLQVAGFQESQVLDLQLLDLQDADSQGRDAQCP